MRYASLAFLGLVLLVGCQGIQEQDAIRPLRENGPKLRYDELLLRARKQVDILTEKALTDRNWGDVIDGCTALEQTVKLLPDAPEGPEKEKKTEMVQRADTLARDARALRAAAAEVPKLTGAEQTKKIKEADEAIVSMTRTVRIMWKTN